MKIELLRIYIVLLASFLSAFSADAFTWGAGGHQIWGGPVWGDAETQFATMERYGLTTYRFDVPLSEKKPHAVDELQKLVELAAKYHITLHPILYVPFTDGDATDKGKYPATEVGLEAQGYDRVYPFVLKFASQIRDWELENELSVKKDVKDGGGYSAEDYETPKAHEWAAVLKGMSKAIRDVEKKTGEHLQTVVDTGYMDFGIIPFFEKNGVSIDKVAYHYYYELSDNPYKINFSETIFNVFGDKTGTYKDRTFDIFAELHKLGKPVIINEFNAAEIYSPINRSIPKLYDDAKALASLKQHIDYISQQKEANIEGIEYYELYNDSDPKLDASESNFGLMKDATHPRTQMLLAAVYACGKLSQEEKKTLISSGLFTDTTLVERLKSCQR